ncbi:BTB/POZ domain-containing protein At5g47800 isoform X2 [Malania oleifera]|uniref:BTB/POZ domain-containing protein At5g47800 isoform X2 n=1 Tax=Malania oleifera TaxID=397392 RepID=UPI0025AE1124|nr:BTB/POZ domain-containing protein At5g47800 isoform X2 [Malania oleifera]
MKFMKLGTRPDTFYTEEATRTVTSDVPSDLAIQINNIRYLLHKPTLLSKCGLLQRLCSDSGDSTNICLQLHDIPGGEDAFEICAKFCYGITINLSAHNFVPAFCAAKFLRMTESIERANFVLKLEAFFNSCILEGWKDSIVTLQTTIKLPEWSENLGIIRRCIDSITEKILTPTGKVTWSYTYTRPGYTKKRHQSIPKDWWTEDVSDLDVELFRCVITAIRSTNMLPSQLIGEALHVFACRWLPDATKNRLPESSTSQTEEFMGKNRQVLENIVGMIPADPKSVSIGFLLRLLNISNFLGASPVTKAEIIRQSGRLFEEATVNDLLFPSHSPSDRHFYDIASVGTVLESFMVLWRRQSPTKDKQQALISIRKVGKLIDSYLQVVSRDINIPVMKVVALAEALPEIARPKHDDLYKAINTYLRQEHPDVTKVEKKRLCRILNCQKFSPQICAHVVKNERLPLRTVVQVLFFEQERGLRPVDCKLPSQHLFQRPQPTEGNHQSNTRTGQEEASSAGGARRRSSTPAIPKRDHQITISPAAKGREIRREGMTGNGSKVDPKKIMQRKSILDQAHKSRDR